MRPFTKGKYRAAVEAAEASGKDASAVVWPFPQWMRNDVHAQQAVRGFMLDRFERERMHSRSYGSRRDKAKKPSAQKSVQKPSSTGRKVGAPAGTPRTKATPAETGQAKKRAASTGPQSASTEKRQRVGKEAPVQGSGAASDAVSGQHATPAGVVAASIAPSQHRGRPRPKLDERLRAQAADKAAGDPTRKRRVRADTTAEITTATAPVAAGLSAQSLSTGSMSATVAEAGVGGPPTTDSEDSGPTTEEKGVQGTKSQGATSTDSDVVMAGVPSQDDAPAAVAEVSEDVSHDVADAVTESDSPDPAGSSHVDDDESDGDQSVRHRS